MNKRDLVAAVSASSRISRADSSKVVDGVFDAITNSLRSKTEVRLVGFGTFSVKRRAAARGRNPRTGKTVQISVSNQPIFKAGKGLKDAVQRTTYAVTLDPPRDGSIDSKMYVEALGPRRIS